MTRPSGVFGDACVCGQVMGCGCPSDSGQGMLDTETHRAVFQNTRGALLGNTGKGDIGYSRDMLSSTAANITVDQIA